MKIGMFSNLQELRVSKKVLDIGSRGYKRLM